MLDDDIRRRYPKDVIGKKEEWEALNIHKHEINKSLANCERDIRYYRNKDMMDNVD